MVQLVPMSEAEFETYQEHGVREYAMEHVEAGNWRPEEALQRAEQEFRELLPNGVASPDQYLFSIVDEKTGTKVGILWFAVQSRPVGQSAFVYDVEIFEQFRRHGYGTQTFLALEEKAREMGLKTISLHVFGHNYAAREMYEKLGYVPKSIWMSKTVE